MLRWTFELLNPVSIEDRRVYYIKALLEFFMEN